MSKEGWETYKLSQLLGGKGYIRGPFGSSLKRGEMKSAGIPVYEQQHAIYNTRDFRFFIDEAKLDEMRRFEVKENDLIVSCSGTIGKISIIKAEDPKGIISQALLLLRPDDTKILPEYLRYYFTTAEGFSNLVSASHGSVQVNIASREIVESIEIKIPDIPTQRRVVAVLSALDDKIELNRQTNATLEATAQAIFKQWFVDFRFPGATGEMQDSELGLIPKGWRTTSFSDAVEIVGGGTPKTSIEEYWNGDIPWFSMADAPEDCDVFVISTEKKVTRAGISNSSAIVLPDGATIITARGTVGKVVLCGVPMALNQSCYGLKGKQDDIGIYTFYLTRSVSSQLKNGANGSVFDTITRNTFEQTAVACPPAELIERFNIAIRAVLMKIKGNLYESSVLSQIRDNLLPKLMSGETRINEVEYRT